MASSLLPCHGTASATNIQNVGAATCSFERTTAFLTQVHLFPVLRSNTSGCCLSRPLICLAPQMHVGWLRPFVPVQGRELSNANCKDDRHALQHRAHRLKLSTSAGPAATEL